MKTNILKILSAKGVVAIFMIAMANALYAQQDKKETNTATADKYAQMFSEPDTVQPCRALNKKIYSAVNAIDAMPLRCDSIFVDEAGSFGRKHFYIGKRLFFDSNNRLRKYRTYKREGSDDADYRIYRFYYDENGKLIYFDYNIRKNGIDTEEYCALHRGIVKEYDCILYDRRYEKDGDTTKGIWCGGVQKVGEPVRLYNYSSSYCLKSFSDTRTLLRVLELYKYPYYSDILEFQIQEFGISRIADEKIRRGLLFAYIIDKKEEKGELKKSKFKFSYQENQGDTVVDRDHIITFTCDSNKRVHRYRAGKYTTLKGNTTKLDESTEACYDTNGSLFLIEYVSDDESFKFYLEDGVISYCVKFRYKDNEGIDDKALERLKRSFVGKKLADIPCKAITLADYATTEQILKRYAHILSLLP